ncbi:MAG: hypothetical protein WKG06_42640 [Segetibacter sp.]
MLLLLSFVAFSYTNHILSWIPYIILGGWVPGKWYGLTLFHSILCVAISIGVIGFFDKKIELPQMTRLAIIILVSLLFTYEAVFNFFFQNGQEVDLSRSRQIALIQLSFLIGILIKAFNKNAQMK